MEIKTCKNCNKEKDLKDFYKTCGSTRSECKRCTIKRNIRYQRLHKTWKERFVNPEERREYMRAYYAKNRDKYAMYREAFRQKFPTYYKDYYSQKKNEKVEE